MTKIYHITHIDNLAGIIKGSGIYCNHTANKEKLTALDIGHNHIKERRDRTPVPVMPGGMVGQYAPFFFCPRPPMLYAIEKGYVDQYKGGQAEVLHLVATAEKVFERHECCYTDGNAATYNLTNFYNDPDRIEQMIDWEAVNAKYWSPADDPDFKRRKQAEFLVKEQCAWELIETIGVLNNSIASRVDAIMVSVGAEHRPRIVVKEDWYYV